MLHIAEGRIIAGRGGSLERKPRTLFSLLAGGANEIYGQINFEGKRITGVN